MLSPLVHEIFNIHIDFYITTVGRNCFLSGDDQEERIFHAFDQALRKAGIRWHGGSERNMIYQTDIGDIQEILQLFPARMRLNRESYIAVQGALYMYTQLNITVLTGGDIHYLLWSPELGIFRTE
jgi:hypothetical protein